MVTMEAETTIILRGKDAKMWAMMKALEGLGMFDVKFGKVTIDFDGQGKIGNVRVEKNYRVFEIEPELSTPQE